ncbi:MAG: LTA synthase family protein [Bacteroidia bacterium]|nr:LTA synthase family protein [Bacteroidia bacterium]MDW8417213.1 LTA synthase family protein [Bacteroidia bacterium]
MWLQGWAYHGVIFAGLLIVRGAFLWWNKEFLAQDADYLLIWLRGMGIDWVAATWLSLPMWLCLLIGRPKAAHWVWVAALLPAFALEVIDVGFFPYTHRRSGPELLQMLTFWRDTLPALGKYVRDFLLGFVFWAALVGGAYRLIRVFHFTNLPNGSLRWIGWLPTIAILAVSARGGVRLKPLLVVDAAIEGCPSCTPFVLNTTFFFVRALEQPPLPVWPDRPAQTPPYPRRWLPDPNRAFAPRYNVVILVLESFSQEYIDAGYAPFLASLLRKGRSVKWGFATNSRSAEGIPAILSSMPSWGEEPLIFTPYVSQISHSLPEMLRNWGYKTAFFHGGNNGTMALDSYAKQAGFSYYFGRNEYPEPDRDYDGTWGIWDEPFLYFCADKIGQLPQPFFATIFTLSSHHPYAIPPHLRDSFPVGTHPIHRAVRYTDWALERFFARIETTAWARKTLFVITADHTGPSQQSYSSTQIFHIPIGFYVMSDTLPMPDTLASQMDILPSVLEAVGYPESVLVWGRSVWTPIPNRWVPQKPFPLVFQAVGPEHVVQSNSTGELIVYRWEKAPWHTRRDSTVPPWLNDWVAYIAGYGSWIEGKRP